ncbi:signal peptidase I [Mycoplasmoides gallisepticum]|uniref:signal peptidase I n=1 Tax=Mycoplasmoides gallisepticum TaxID=2096 RepID=UPI00001A3F88|nr:signal peptidase I [Mycoplasmoides gallisepticum]
MYFIFINISYCFYLFFTFFLVKINGNSMLPLLKNGEWKLAFKYGPYNQKDIIIFEQNGVNVVKMIVGKEGDKIIIKNNNLFINNNLITSLFMGNFGDDIELIVPKNHFFVLGTNLNFSDDSRVFGFINSHQIIGKILF